MWPWHASRPLLPLLVVAAGSAGAAEWEVVLFKPRDCGNCVYLEEILKRRAQLHQVQLDDGAGNQVTAAIVRRTGEQLSPPELAQLRALPYHDELLWRQRSWRSLQVLLKHDGVIVAAGDIEESADLRGVRLPASVTLPATGGNLAAVRNAHGTHLAELYLRSWNLDWFYRLALDPALHRARHEAWVTAGTGEPEVPLGAANVLLMATAYGAADNEIFNAIRIEEIREVLTQQLPVDPGQLHVFYGSDNARGANALEVRDRRVSLVRRDVAGASAFTADAARRIFQSIRARPGSRNLLVLVGHGSPDGAGMWSSPVALSSATLRSLHEHGGGDDVLVSGNCFGGVMARATSCGFFGARPDVVATGCQADAAEVAESRDYLHVFFQSLAPASRELADADGDGGISFAEAHWHASAAGDARNVTYTSIDALADEWFDANAAGLPRSLPVADILALATVAPAAEARAAGRILDGLDAQVMVPLVDLAAQAANWQPGEGTPRVLAGQLARRLLYLREHAQPDTTLSSLQSCENRPIAEFLEP